MQLVQIFSSTAFTLIPIVVCYVGFILYKASSGDMLGQGSTCAADAQLQFPSPNEVHAKQGADQHTSS